MKALTDEIEELISIREGERIEFKEAKSNFHFEKLVKYCCALANERGGRMVLGMTDQPPRQIVGSNAFSNLERTKAGLLERLHLRIHAHEVNHVDGRVVIFDVPSRAVGMPIAYEGAYWMRAGEDLVPMTPHMLRRIFDEAGPDFSAEICAKARFTDLAPEGIELLRAMWFTKSGNRAVMSVTAEQLLYDLGVIEDEGVTFAALVLLGKAEALDRVMPQAEVIFEYRSSDASGPPQARELFRQGFLLFREKLWDLINLRNDNQHFQRGLQVLPIPTFNERATREAILNAVSHRDYRLGGSVFIRQYPRRLEFDSPGGFPAGITVENALWRQLPRNRRIAEVFEKCDLVERSGQGINIMFERCIAESKALPDFSGSDDHLVHLMLPGQIRDPQFARFFVSLQPEQTKNLTTQDFLVLDAVHEQAMIREELKARLPFLLESGLIEKSGHNRYMLSRSLYASADQKGSYTRKRGLDHQTNKQMLLQHIETFDAEGSPLRDLMGVLPTLSYNQLQRLVKELRQENKIHFSGSRRSGRWFLGAGLLSPKPNENRNKTAIKPQ